MNSYDKVKNFVLNLQNLEEQQKKMIVFVIIIISAIILIFINIKFTKNTISKIGNNINSDNLYNNVNFNEQASNFQNNSIESGLETTNTAVENIPLDQLENSLKDQHYDWQKYQNETYGFSINYPKDWQIDKNQTTDLDIWLEKIVEKEVASLHIEIASKTQNIKSTKEGVDYIISQMKNIIKPEKQVIIQNSEAYEVIGTICTSICNGSSEDIYSPFSIIYIAHNDTVIKIKYSEGTLGTGWKNSIDNWKYYDEYKQIISTIIFNTL